MRDMEGIDGRYLVGCGEGPTVNGHHWGMGPRGGVGLGLAPRNGRSQSKAVHFTWHGLRLSWIALKIALNLLCFVVGIAVVLLSIAVMAVSVMRVFLPRT